MSNALTPVLTAEQHIKMSLLDMSAPSPIENIIAALAYVGKKWDELVGGPGWDEFRKAAEKAEQFLIEYGYDDAKEQ